MEQQRTLRQSSAGNQATFVARSIQMFRQNITVGYFRVSDWRQQTVGIIDDYLSNFNRALTRNIKITISWLAVFIYIALISWFVWDALSGRIGGDIIQTGVGGLVGAAILGLVFSPIIALCVFLTILILNWTFKILTPIALFIPLLVWMLLFGLVQTAIVLAKLLLLIPLIILFFITRLVELWRGIFYTCPSRTCAYRGLPTYVCPECGTANHNLQPNLFGVLWHRCERCDGSLPTLDILGRKKLDRHCGGNSCNIPLLGKHAGRSPERLVAIAGGVGSGKTSYLLMAVSSVINGSEGNMFHLLGEIDDPVQEEDFQRVWKDLSLGLPTAKTVEVAKAFLLYVKAGLSRCQLYLYDAPGEEFSSLTSMKERHYIPLLEGIVFLLDPLSFDVMQSTNSGLDYKPESFKTVIENTLATTLKGVEVNRNGKIPMRAAVVISKADLRGVRDSIGDIREQYIRGQTCREAIRSWGGESELRLIEHRFESVEYFACSPLGRAFDPENRQAFKGAGVLEPLVWILTGARNKTTLLPRLKGTTHSSKLP